VTVSTFDLHWVAGFLEGEGCFDYQSKTPRVRAILMSPKRKAEIEAAVAQWRAAPRRGMGNHVRRAA